MEKQNETVFRAWLGDLQRGATGAELAAYFHPDVLSHELPNLLFPAGVDRDGKTLLEAAERGQRAVRDQHIVVEDLVASGDLVAARLTWSAKLRVAFGARAEGDELRCWIGSFARFRDGRIVEHWSYDCYARD